MSISNVSALRLLDNVSVPEALDVRVTSDPAEFMRLQGQFNSGLMPLFGVAYRQGNRLHFGTAMGVADYIKLTRVDQASPGSTVDELAEHANRPKEKGHAKDIGKYLAETACVGLPFIFPSFVVNFGLGWSDSAPKAQLIILAGPREALAWPAIFAPPADAGLKVTDGGHRTDELGNKWKNGVGRLGENALSVLFVMEQDNDAYRQDFADCAKAKPIAKSLTATWDLRDASTSFGVQLVKGNAYLHRHVDASANSVNLSNNASKIWSMSAVQSAVNGLHKTEKDTTRISEFFDLCFEKLPILADVAAGNPPGPYRREKGGCVLLRGVGVAVLVQAFNYCIASNAKMADVVDKLATLNWHVLKDGAPAQDGQEAAVYIHNHGQYIWKNMVAMMAGDDKFRIKGTHDAAKDSFERIRNELAF